MLPGDDFSREGGRQEGLELVGALWSIFIDHSGQQEGVEQFGAVHPAGLKGPEPRPGDGGQIAEDRVPC